MSINIPIPKIIEKRYFEAKPPQDGEIKGVDYITCPICGATMRTHIKKHLMKQHQMSMEEFKEKYPDNKTFPYKWNKKRKETRGERKKANFVLLPKYEVEEKIDKKKEDEKKCDIIEKIEKVEETEKKEDFFIENPFEIIYNEFKRTEKRIKRMEDMLKNIKDNLEEMKNMWE